MKLKRILILTSIIPLSSCGGNVLNRDVYAFDTMNSFHLYSGTNEDLDELEKIVVKYDKLTDNYKNRDVTNVYKINSTNEDIEVSEELYDLLKLSDSLTNEFSYFNMYCGGLAKLWKNALNSKQIPDESQIEEQLKKLQNTKLLFKENNIVQRVGDGEIDLGAIAKGYAMDVCYDYLKEKEIDNYAVSFGGSSDLLGDKTYSGADTFEVSIKNTNYYLKLHNCYISTSGIEEQHAEIDGKVYSHIVNPVTGGAISVYDTVIVISDKGYLGDVLSTVFMMSNLETIKQAETKYDVKAIVLSNKNIVYKNSELELFDRSHG